MATLVPVREYTFAGDTYTDFEADYLGYRVYIMHSPNGKYAAWVSLLGQDVAGPCMDFESPEAALAWAKGFIRQCEQA